MLNSNLAAKPDVISLGALECASSAVVTGLNMKGKEYRYFIADYWNLKYESAVLLSSRSVALYNLEALYGIKLDFVEVSLEALIGELGNGNIVIYSVQASKLGFFPKSMLGFENQVLGHALLVYKYELTTQMFTVVDPIVPYTGEISINELIQASLSPCYANMIIMRFDEESSLSSEKSLHFSAERNYDSYNLDDTSSGRKALREFRKAAEASLEWEQELRREWVKKNSISIMTIIRIRGMVWDSYRSLAGFANDVIDSGDKSIEEILKLWNSLSFNMIKHGRQAKVEYVEAIIGFANQIEMKELDFLEFVYCNIRLVD